MILPFIGSQDFKSEYLPQPGRYDEEPTETVSSLADTPGVEAYDQTYSNKEPGDYDDRWVEIIKYPNPTSEKIVKSETEGIDMWENPCDQKENRCLENWGATRYEKDVIDINIGKGWDGGFFDVPVKVSGDMKVKAEEEVKITFKEKVNIDGKLRVASSDHSLELVFEDDVRVGEDIIISSAIITAKEEISLGGELFIIDDVETNSLTINDNNMCSCGSASCRACSDLSSLAEEQTSEEVQKCVEAGYLNNRLQLTDLGREKLRELELRERLEDLAELAEEDLEEEED